LERDDEDREHERIANRVVPEDLVMVELAIVVPSDKWAFEDRPVVAADVEGVPDRKDEEDEEEGHREGDEAVADKRLAQPLGSERPHLLLLRDRNRHLTSPYNEPAPRAPQAARRGRGGRRTPLP